MYKSDTKATAVITVIALLMSLLSVFVLPVYAQAPVPDDFEPQKTLDYNALFEDALVVNTGWSSLSGKLSFVYQGKSYSETYNKSRHFNDFNTAVSAWSQDGVPVIIVNGTLAGDLKLESSVIVLGANAGKSPNAEIDLATVNPTNGWPAATLNNQTVIEGTFTFATEASVVGAKTYDILFDGITFGGTGSGFKAAEADNDANKTVNVTLQHTLVKQSASSAVLFDHRFSNAVFNYSVSDVRVEKASFQSMIAVDAKKIHINSLCFNDNSAAIITGAMSTSEFDFDLRNSYIYNNHVGYTINAQYTQEDHHVSNIDIHNNIFYNSNTGNYGFMIFHTTENSPKSVYNVNVRNNTFMSTDDSRTLFNGSSNSYQKGAFTLNCNYNRVIGYVSLFPNMSLNSALSWEGANMIKADFNYNYFNTTYTSHADVIDEETWERSDYYCEHPYIDPFDSELIVYYKDYMLTVRDGMFDVTSADFFDEVDALGIDNDNNEISITIPKGTTISGLSKDYGFNFATEPDSVLYYYKDKAGDTDIKVPVTSLSAAPPDSFEMYFVDVTYKTYTETYLITVYGDTTTSAEDFEGNFTDPAGEMASSAYLYVPGLSGTTYTLLWNGSHYSFKVGDNAFDSLDKIFTQAKSDGISVPQILVPAGNHGKLTISASCEIYGYNYLTAATGGVLADTRYPGTAWNTTKRTVFTGIDITGGSSVKLSGVTVNGNVTDTSTPEGPTRIIKNSIINGYIDMSTGSAGSKAGSLTLSGVLVENGGGVLVKGNIARTLTLSNVYTKNGVTQLFDKGWAVGLKDLECRINITDSRFDGVGDSFIPSPVTEAFTDAKVTINNSAFFTESEISNLVIADSAKYTTELTGNAFINKGAKACTLISGAPSVFAENRIIGFNPGFTADYNYLADYTSNFKTVFGGKQYGDVFYMDYALTVLNTEYGIEKITLGDSGAKRAEFSNTSKVVRITLGSGDASSVKIFMQGGIEAAVYSDIACTVPASLKTAVYGKTSYFYTKTDFAAASGVYRIIVDSTGSGNDFAFDFESDGTIQASAIAISSAFAPYANGDGVYMTWQGKDWYFVKGINAFESMDEMLLFANEKALRSPQLIIGKYSGDLVIDYGCEVYSQNYNTVPYIRTDSFDGSDWSYNTGYDKYKTTVGSIIIGENAKGAVKVYGFEMTGTYKDISRPVGSMLNVHLENILINNKLSAMVLFNQNGDNLSVNASTPRNENTDIFTVKNSYIQSSVSTRFMYEWHSQTVEFDGLYMDCATYPIAATNYVKQAGADTKLIFRNCNFRNLFPTANLFQYEGNRVTVSKGQYRQFIFENNVFYNFMFSNNGFLPFYPANFTGVTMQGNRIFKTSGQQNLFYNMYNSTSYTPITLTIKDNVFAGFNTTASLGTNKANATASEISGNFIVPTYTARAKGQPLTVTANPTINCINYALDDTLEPLNTDFVLESVTGSGVFALEDMSVTATLVGITLSDVSFTFGNKKIQPQFYSDEGLTKQVDAATITEGTYYMRGVFNTESTIKFYGEEVYTVTVSGNTTNAPLFSKTFEDELIPKTALLIDKDSASATLLYETTWCGTKYAFVKNVNAFETLADAVAYVKAEGIEDAHFMLKDIDGYKGDSGILDFFVPHPGSYYTQNYNIKPYIRGTAQDGSDWKSNIGTGAGQFNTANGITCLWIGFNKCPSGDYKLYGFTVRSCIQDGTRTGTTINALMQNTYFRDTHNGYSAFTNNNATLTEANNTTDDTITFKDMYYVDQSTNSFFRTGIGYVWTNTVFDGLFADFSGSPHLANDSIVRNRAQYGQTVYKNCNLRNFRSDTPYITFASIDEATSIRGSRKLILEDNIFYNYCFYDKTHFLGVKLGYHTDVILRNNAIYLDDKAELIYTPEGDGNGITDDLNIVVTGNHMRGIDATVYLENRTLSPTSVIEANYLSSSVKYLRNGVKLAGVNNLDETVVGGAYYVDKEMTLLSNVIDKMTFDGMPFDSNLDYTVPSETTTLNVSALLEKGKNTVEFYIDSDLELAVDPENVALSSLGRTIYMLVTSYDGTNSVLRELRINREQGCVINNTGLGSSPDRVEDGITFNWVGWLGTVNATGMTVNAADKITHRVGALYLSDVAALDTVKAEIEARIALQTEPDSIEKIVTDVNNKYVGDKTIKAYYFHKDHTLVWNNEKQAYGFRYNFSVQKDYYRGVVMYVVYQDENGELQIKFSDLVVQQA